MPVDAITWRKAVARPAFIRAMASGCLAGLAVVWVLPRIFAWIQAKPGLLLHDPVLTVWGPENVTWATFAVLYGTLLLVISSIARKPMTMLQGLWAEVASAMGIEDGRESISFWNALAQRLGEEGYRQIVEKVEEIRNLVSRLLEREREIQLRLEGQVGELRQKLLTLQKGRQAFRGYIKHDGASG